MAALDVAVAHVKWWVGGKPIKARDRQVICEVAEMGKKIKRKGNKESREMPLAEAFQMAISKETLYLQNLQKDVDKVWKLD